jgi:hypothetical protein
MSDDPRAPQTPPGGPATPAPAPEPDRAAPGGTAPPRPGIRLLTLLVLDEQGEPAAAWEMPAHSPSGLVRQIGELDAAGADLTPFARNPARWQVTDQGRDGAAFWQAVLEGRVGEQPEGARPRRAHYHDAAPATPCHCPRPGTYAATSRRDPALAIFDEGFAEGLARLRAAGYPQHPIDLPEAHTDNPALPWRVAGTAGDTADYSSRPAAYRAVRELPAGPVAVYVRRDNPPHTWDRYEVIQDPEAAQ